MSRGDLGAQASEKIGRYRILKILGEGGMGKVFQAFDPDLQRVVALKLLKESDYAEDLRAELLKEARALAQISHPNVVAVHEISEDPGCAYIAMEFVQGRSLKERIQEGIPSAEWTAKTVWKIAQAMHHAHLQNVLHRDLKPANIMLSSDETPKITDFGLAKILDAEASISTSGVIVGTPVYIPPEQITGDRKNIDRRSDVYGVGALMYEALTGRPPFQGRDLMEVADAVLRKFPEAPSSVNPTVPEELEAICLKCLEKKPLARYQSARALAQDFERHFDGRPVLACKQTFSYRMRKWAGRNRTAILRACFWTLLLCSLAFNAVFLLRSPALGPSAPASARMRSQQAGRADAVEKSLEAIDEEDWTRRDLGLKVGAAKEESARPANPERTESLIRSFWRTVAILAKEDAPLAEIETRFSEMEKKLGPSHLLHRYWGLLCLAYADRQIPFESRVALLEKAMDRFDRSLEIFPKDGLACFWAYHAACRYNSPPLWPNKMKRYRESLDQYAQEPYLSYVQARDLYTSLLQAGCDASAWKQLLESCRAILSKNPDFAPAHGLSSKVYLMLENYPMALADCQRALAICERISEEERFLEPYYIDFLCLRAKLAIKTDDFPGALATCERILGMASGNYEARVLRAKCLRRKRDYDEACADLSAALESKVHIEESYRLRAEVHWEMEKYSLALADARSWMALEPENHEPYELIARVYQSMRKYAEAYDFVERALQYAPRREELLVQKMFLTIYRIDKGKD